MATVTRRVRPDVTVAHSQVRRWPGRQFRLMVRLSLVVAAIVGLWALWNFTATPVEIVVDGHSLTINTHRRAVGSLLSDLGLSLDQLGEPQSAQTEVGTVATLGLLRPGTGEGEGSTRQFEEVRISHSLDTRIVNGMRISVERPRPFHISADGRETLISSWASTPVELLRDAGIPFNSYDRLTINGELTSWDQEIPRDPPKLNPSLFGIGSLWGQIGNDPLRIEIDRSALLVIDEGSIPYTIHTMSETVGEALLDAEITIYLGDNVQPSLGTPVSTGMRVLIQRSTPISLLADGRLYKTRTLSRTVGEALAEIGIGLAGLDEVSPSLDAIIFPDMQISIVRIIEEIDLEEEIAPFETVWIGDRDLLIDTRRVEPGAYGITRRRYRTRFVDGEEVERVLEDVWVAQEPRDRVIVYGQNIIPQTLITDDGKEIVYWRSIRMRATSYSASTAGVPTSVPWFGITRTGDPMRKGVVAVDPRYIPLRTKVYVPGYGIGDALDTGGNIKIRRIDLGYDDDNLELWSSWVDVYLLWPPPPEHQIVWVVPDWPIEP